VAMLDSVQEFVGEFVMIDIQLNMPEEKSIVELRKYIVEKHQFGELFKWDIHTSSGVRDWSEVCVFVCVYRGGVVALNEKGRTVFTLGCGNTLIKTISTEPNVSLVIDG